MAETCSYALVIVNILQRISCVFDDIYVYIFSLFLLFDNTTGMTHIKKKKTWLMIPFPATIYFRVVKHNTLSLLQSKQRNKQ